MLYVALLHFASVLHTPDHIIEKGSQSAEPDSALCPLHERGIGQKDTHTSTCTQTEVQQSHCRNP